MKKLTNRSQKEYFDEYVVDKMSEIRKRIENLSLDCPTFPGTMALLTRIFDAFEAQLFAMERMYKNWNDWRVRLGVWLIRRTELYH